jgi:hypothetical protein
LTAPVPCIVEVACPILTCHCAQIDSDSAEILFHRRVRSDHRAHRPSAAAEVWNPLVGEPPQPNCSFYDGWRDQLEGRHTYSVPGTQASLLQTAPRTQSSTLKAAEDCQFGFFNGPNRLRGVSGDEQQDRRRFPSCGQKRKSQVCLIGAKDLKDFAGPVRAWAALRDSSAEGRFEATHASGLTALVGREKELELLLRRWSRAKTGEGQVVLLSGEAFQRLPLIFHRSTIAWGWHQPLPIAFKRPR